jgi:hypothetical protein
VPDVEARAGGLGSPGPGRLALRLPGFRRVDDIAPDRDHHADRRNLSEILTIFVAIVAGFPAPLLLLQIRGWFWSPTSSPRWR